MYVLGLFLLTEVFEKLVDLFPLAVYTGNCTVSNLKLQVNVVSFSETRRKIFETAFAHLDDLGLALPLLYFEINQNLHAGVPQILQNAVDILIVFGVYERLYEIHHKFQFAIVYFIVMLNSFPQLLA